MNPKKILILITVLIFAVLMNAQFASFRSMSTAGILDGDIEYILVPGELAYVDGFNVYTNLSNFANTSENVFSGSTSYNYLAGTKFDYMGMHTGILHRSNNSSLAEDEVTVSNYFEDRSGNTEYDYHAKDSIFEHDNSAMHIDQTYYGFAYGERDEMRFGFAYTRYNVSNHNTQEDLTVSSSDDLVTGDLLSSSYIVDDFNGVFANTEQDFELSIYMPMDMMDIGFNVHYGPALYKQQQLWEDSMYEDRAPGGTATNYYHYQEVDESDYQFNAQNWGLGTVVKRDCEDYMGEFNIAYNNSTLGRPEFFNNDYTYNYFETTPTAIGNDTLEITETLTNQDSDSLSLIEGGINTLSTGIKYVRKLDKALFGFGVGFSMQSRDTLYIDYFDAEYTEHYNDGDGVADAGDYDITRTESYTRRYDWNSVNHSLRFPVGVEFNANKSLVFRLGAATTFTWDNSFASTKYTSWTPETRVYEDATGYISETIIDDPGTRTDSEIEAHEFTKETDYTYGLGWKISDNFSVDLMGFANLTDMTGWKISANAKF